MPHEGQRDTGPSAARQAAAIAVEDRLYAALAIVRIVVLINAVVLNLLRRGDADHPVALAAVIGVMIGWTGVVIWAYSGPTRRGPALLVSDLAVTLGCLGASPLVLGAGIDATIPGFWVMGALLAWAVHWHAAGGLAAAVLLSIADVVPRDHFEQVHYGNIFLLLIGGPIVGYLCHSLTRLAEQRDAAQREAAAAAERARLARAVHDGVLQVLALVQRRGADLGADGAELARLAGEQQDSLRSLIRQQDMVQDHQEQSSTHTNLAASLEQLVASHPARAELAGPGHAVLLPTERSQEITAVVSACLDNVVAHAGLAARAWVLLEADRDHVTVVVRDDGPGIPEGRLAEAEAAGRLGVADSIRGRTSELGGIALLDTGVEGTEWEVRVPR